MTERPIPTFRFTIPSLHDNTELECRIYHPKCTSIGDEYIGSWHPTRALVVAHPYASLGGCYDDPIVLCLVEEFLEKDYVVGTFNFRGAGESKGHTSWTARPETQDHISFIGLVVCYMHYLRLVQFAPHSDPPQTPISLVLSGYSYGAMVTTLLSTTPALLSHFTSPSSGSAAAEIRLRASRLARSDLESQSHTCPPHSNNSRDRSPIGLRPPSSPIVMGGEESTPGSRTPSNNRPSIDAFHIRESLERSRQKLRHSKDYARSSQMSSPGSESMTPKNPKDSSLEAIELPELKTAYLLISPILGSVAGLATMFSASSARDSGEEKFLGNETMVVFGDEDVFTSLPKLKRWCEELKSRSGKGGAWHFRYREVEGAGHFWRERGVEEKMREAVGEWIGDVLGT